MNFPFFSVGHSNRTLEEFVQLLQAAQVAFVADIRTVPKSRANPQYNEDSLLSALPEFQIAYERIPELGGLRAKSKIVAPGVNGLWINRSFHNYADYAMSDEFRHGLVRLIELGRSHRCAMMCSEAVWWRCHRRIVTDYLLARNEKVFHLMDSGRIVPATLTKGARVTCQCTVVYPSSEQ